MKIIITLSILMFLGSCQTPKKKAPLRQTFKMPIYDINYALSADTTTLLKLDSIMPYYPSVMRTKYSFQDTILRLQMGLYKLENDEDFKPIQQPYDTTAKSSAGLTLLADYKQNIIPNKHRNYYCYPVYIINEKKHSLAFSGKDSYVFAIQEALHPNGKWYPIEQRGFDFCGNGHWDISISPQEFMVFFVPKYQGEYKTKIRVRLRITNKILLSSPVTGYISMKQFLLGKQDKKWQAEKPAYIKGNFYSALPFEFDTKASNQ